jgi:hypothetical protein
MGSRRLRAIMTSAPVQAMVYLAVAFGATRLSPHRGFEVAAAVLAAFSLTAPLRVVLGKKVLVEAVSCLVGAALLYVAIVFTVKAAGAFLGEESLALALFVPVFAGTLTTAILVRLLTAWRSYHRSVGRHRRRLPPTP